MASLIPGYEYDIFISYRQKDNKHDGWVAEFVDNLKGELESMFKDEVSVYFDINPSDYLLESYDVDASLRDKLKCLIFIPIISRTYCDPKSFAWDNELKAFVNIASNDKYGFKIKLPNGNVANRVLPVRIHDLDSADIKLFESVVGGVIRSIDFVYKETGVNRQLRAKDDDIIKSSGQIFYRDQINKVALAVKDLIESIRHLAFPESVGEKVTIGEEDISKKELLIRKHHNTNEDIKQRSREIRIKKSKKTDTVPSVFRQKIILSGLLAITSVLILIFVAANHYSKIKLVHGKAISSLYQLTNEGKYIEAFDLAVKTEKKFHDDSELKRIWSGFSNFISTKSEPEGAKIFYMDYDSSDSVWKYVGTTPLDSVRFPLCFARIKVEKSGYQTIYDATNSVNLNIRNYILDDIGKLQDNMVHIPGIKISLDDIQVKNEETAEIKDFLIDKYEVTNQQYKKFVDMGGYGERTYWKQPFIKNGKAISWEEAMSVFTDKTGRSGPSTWAGGDYPGGEENFPVGGVSWYEAAAYAEFSGKSLPTCYHWRRAAGLDFREYLPRLILAGDGVWGISFVILNSNINSQGPAKVGLFRGMTSFGTMDMVGNVREWCWNEIVPDDSRVIMGGGWSDPTYLSSEYYYQPPFDRSAINGFRCAKYLHNDEDLKVLHSPKMKPIIRDYMNEKPVSDQQFEVLKRMYVYDKSDMHATIESEDKSDPSWIKQKITFDSPYAGERIMAYLFLPRSYSPPYHTVVYFPGSSALIMLSSKTLVGMSNIDFMVKNGRAVIYPIFKGTYERQFESTSYANNEIAKREHVIQWYKDMARSIDYLETRTDIDTSKIAYFGFSWGGRLGPIMTALDKRIKLSILYVAGIKYTGPYPEVDPFNYVGRVRIPTLMLNGKYDADFPYISSQKPLYELLGTAKEDKRQFLYETSHFVPRNELIKETLAWLDKYFGPANHLPNK